MMLILPVGAMVVHVAFRIGLLPAASFLTSFLMLALLRLIRGPL
jgi:hypothetical protein